MKISKCFFSILFAASLLSCSVSEKDRGEITGESGINYNESKSLWKSLKAKNSDDYRYTVSFISWTGISTHTSIYVKDGIISKREYRKYEQTQNDEGELVEVEIESYTETGEEIGSNAEGFDPFLIDELYEICISEYLIVNREENQVYFDTDDAGIISNCGFVENGCVDDCFIGFRISKFEWL